MKSSFTRLYPENKRPFNIADYMHTNTNTRRDGNINPKTKQDSFAEYISTVYRKPQVIEVPMRACKFNEDGTMKTVPLGECHKEDKVSTSTRKKGITLADIMNYRERRSFF